VWLKAGDVGLLLLHGYGESLETWDEVVAQLQPALGVVGLDLRGHGDSGWPTSGDYSLEATVRDLHASVDQLGFGRIVLAGHSTGGMTALAYAAAETERVAALALLDVDPMTFKEGLELILPYRGPEQLASFEDFVGALARRPGAPPPDLLAARLAPKLRRCADGSWTWKQDPRLRPAVRRAPRRPRDPKSVHEMMDRVRAPTLLLRGERSTVVSREMAADALGGLGASHKRLIEIPGSGHAILSENPLAVAQALNGFLRDVLP
jgi:pimeloyl-ACP methyl ester carboxylesterase